MLTVTVTLWGANRQRAFRGITSASRKLGVTRQHLYLVLTGQRVSPRITRSLRLVDKTHVAENDTPGAGEEASGK